MAKKCEQVFVEKRRESAPVPDRESLTFLKKLAYWASFSYECAYSALAVDSETSANTRLQMGLPKYWIATS
tara:strand:+ start:850 stop:1062 length:213 start_codon:yes stop_codon:yes gene_type:complete